MSELAKFINNPFDRSNIHRGYSESFLHMTPAPEYASGEVLVSSIYRAIGFPNIPEGDVPEKGKKFIQRMKSEHENLHVLDQETWKLVINSTLESPRLPSQSAKRVVSLCPVVPWVAAYSGSARMTRMSWNPGNLIKRMIRFGCNSHTDASNKWRRFFDALSIDDSDDPWSRLLCQEFIERTEASENWTYRDLEIMSQLNSWKLPNHSFPSQQFVEDLDKIIDLKPRLTRRQWVSILESLLRIASVSHIAWLCELNARTFSLLRDALGGNKPETLRAVENRLFENPSTIWDLNVPILKNIRKIARSYLEARVGINYFLFLVEQEGYSNPHYKNIDMIGSVAWIFELASILYNHRNKLDYTYHMEQYFQATEKDIRILSCKKGIGKNIEEFSRHVLGQRLAADDRFLTYDQGYFARKQAQYTSAPWKLSPGPVAVMMLCHCCVSSSTAPRTVEHLCEHLSSYKIGIKPNEIRLSEFGRTLRNLGLVLDSPDAEGGMVVLDPFKT